MTRPNIGWGKFILCLIMVGVSTAYVVAALFYDYVFDLKFGDVPNWVYIVGFAWLAYQGQIWLSEAAGGRRIVDHLVSRVMLVAIAVAVMMWVEFPIVHAAVNKASVWIGHPITPDQTSYKVGVALVFGALSVVDFFRDWFGRRSQYTFHGGTATTLAGGALPPGHDPVTIPSRTGLAEYQTEMPIDILPRFRLVMPDGRRVPTEPTQRVTNRVIDHEMIGNGNGGDGHGN